jgi:4-hydroxy-4-methyl-2-oxoglutarate aldolase
MRVLRRRLAARLADVSDRIATAWRELATATVADSVPAATVLAPGLVHLGGPPRMVGVAWTVRTGRGGYDAVREAIATAPPASVLVLAGGGDLGHAIWGELSTTRAHTRGVVGVLVDGAVRDLAAIRHGPLTIFARGGTPAGPVAGVAGQVGAVVECAGAAVAPGDLVLADADGVVIVPAELAQVGLRLALAAAERERLRLLEVGGSARAAKRGEELANGAG